MKARTYESAESLRRQFVKDPVADLLDGLRERLEVATDHAERQAIVDAAGEAAAALAGDNDELLALTVQIDAVANPPVERGVWDKTRADFVDASVLAGENPTFKRVLDEVAKAANAGEVDEIVAAALGSDVEWTEAEVGALWSVTDGQVDDGTALSVQERDERDAAATFARLVKDQEEAEAAEQAPTLLADELAEAEA